MKRSTQKLLVTTALILDVLLIVTIVATTPKLLGPLGVTLWFVLVVAASGSTLASLLYYIKIKFGRDDQPRRVLGSSLRQAFLLAIWLVALLALKSLGQLGVRDVVLISLIIGLIEFYGRTPK